MAVAAQKQKVTRTETTASREGGMPFLLQVSTLTWRSLMTILRSPAEIIPSIFISVFFLLIYEGSFSQAASFIPGLGANYIAFILPFSLVSGALSGSSSASQNLVRDIENGYFDKLLLTPVSRAALLLGPILAGGLALAVQTIIVILLGLLLGLESVTGILGLIAVL
ncbi:MAG: hypothetical protein H7Y09_15920, partial [Chitinophagaceae bacterium]|nr:hypothetical protein [Anaerolineae bacterium]